MARTDGDGKLSAKLLERALTIAHDDRRNATNSLDIHHTTHRHVELRCRCLRFDKRAGTSNESNSAFVFDVCGLLDECEGRITSLLRVWQLLHHRREKGHQALLE